MPSDGNPCTNDVCTSGQPSNPPAPAGTSCGTGGLCNGAGACVGCLVDADCGTTTACVTYACGATGVCALTYVPSGQGNPSGQTSGDCRKIVCNGSGGTMSVADDTDVPASTNPCMIVGCSMGQPTQTPSSAGTPCGAGSECDGAGSCVTCLVDTDCGTPTVCARPACVGGTCVPGYAPSGQIDPNGQTTGNCQEVVCNGSGGTMSIPDDTNLPTNGGLCQTVACVNGVPTYTSLPAGTSCGTGLECDGTWNCVGCFMDSECGVSTACATYSCQEGTCATEYTPAGTGNPGDQVAGDCQVIMCDGSGGMTIAPDDTDVHNDGNPCTTDSCSSGVPQHTPAASGTSCGAGLYCWGTTCGPPCLIGGSTYVPGKINPGNACQVCNPSVSTTAWSPVADGTTCNDGSPCTSGDHCTSGKCIGTPLADGTACDDGSPCTSGDQCASGACVGTPLADGTACSDGNTCTSGDQCTSGQCIGTVLADNTPCQGVDPIWGSFNGGCNRGECIDHCIVNGKYYSNNSMQGFLDADICGMCDPSVSTTSLYAGGCHTDGYEGSCDGAGGCWLLTGPGNCNPECQDCSPTPCARYGVVCYGFPKPAGTLCPGIDACHGLCTSYGNCYTTAPVPDGTSCGAGMTCTAGVCD